MSANSATTVESTLQVAWPLPLWLLLLLVIAAVLFVGWIYFNERGTASRSLRILLASIRLLLLLLVLWMILGWSWQRMQTQQPELVIALDVSDSMLTPDEKSTPTTNKTSSRLERAQQLLLLSNEQLTSLRNRYQLRTYILAEDALSQQFGSNSPALIDWTTDWRSLTDTRQSRLGEALSRVIDRQAGRGTAAILLLSDGINTGGATLADAGQRAKRAGIPVYTVTLGQQAVQPDLRISDILSEQHVYLGDRVNIQATIAGSDVREAKLRVQLIDSANDTVLDEQRVSLSHAESQQTVSLGFVPEQPGEHAMRVVVGSLPNELNVANNRTDLKLTVQDQVIRVLLVFAQPSYEFRFIKHFLERSSQRSDHPRAAFELTSVLQEGDADYVLQDISAERFVPTDPQSVSKFDAFIFGPMDPSLMPRSTQQAIVHSVTHGGAGCIFLASKDSPRVQLAGWPLDALLPVEATNGRLDGSDGYQLTPTQLGKNSLPSLWLSGTNEPAPVVEKFPLLHTVLRVETVKPGAQVLAEAVSLDRSTRSPLLVVQFAGAGRTALLATDETYRWTGLFGSDRYHQQLWGHTLRWLSRGKIHTQNDAQLEIEPKIAKLGTDVRFQVRLPQGISAPEQITVNIEGTTDQTRSLTLMRRLDSAAVYHATVNDLATDGYRAVVTQPAMAVAPSADFSVVADPTEQATLQSDNESMRLLAERSRGKALVAEQAQRWPANLPPGRAARLGALPPLAIWNQHWVAALFVSLITSEWLLRRYVRML